MQVMILDLHALHGIFLIHSYDTNITRTRLQLWADNNDVTVFDARCHAVPLHFQRKCVGVFDIVDRDVLLNVIGVEHETWCSSGNR